MKDFAERYRSGAFAIFAVLVVTLSLFILLPFAPAILWATVLAILMTPLYRSMTAKLDSVRFLRKRDLSGTVSSLFTTLITLVLICVPFLLIGLGLFAQIADVTRQIEGGPNGTGQALTVQGVADQIDAMIKPVAERIGVHDFSASDYVRQNGKEIAKSLQQPLGKAAKAILFAAVTIVIALLTMFFMLRDGERLKEPAIELIPLPRERTEALFKRIAETVHAVFIGTVLVAIIQGTIMGLAFLWAGIPNAFLLGVISAVLCIVPLLGAPVLYVPLGLMLLARGDVPGALKILIIGFAVVSQIDNLLKPFFIGGRVNLHPMAIFFSILGGVLLLGPIGVMAGPMVLTVLLAVQEVAREWSRVTTPEIASEPTQ